MCHILICASGVFQLSPHMPFAVQLPLARLVQSAADRITLDRLGGAQQRAGAVSRLGGGYVADCMGH